MFRQNSQNIEANAFSEARFVQEPVTLGFLQRFGNALGRDGLQIEMHEDLLAAIGSKHSEQSRQWVEEAIHNTLLQGNDGVVGDGDVLRTHLGATFCNVAQPDAVLRSQFGGAICLVQWMHFQRRRINQETRPDELVVHVMLTKHVAHVLAKVTLNAFAKLLDAIDIRLRHAPGPVRSVWTAWLEFRYALFHIIVP